MTYADFVAALANACVRQPTNPDFLGILPRCIEQAEQRLYRELDLAANSVRLTGSALGTAATLTTGNRNLVLAVGTFVVLEAVNVVTPAGAASPEAGTRNRLVLMGWDALDMLYGAASPLGLPVYFALQDAATVAVGPWPDQPYSVEILGTVRPAPLGPSNTTTVLTTYFPDLFFAAAMVFMSGWMRNFGAQSDDPRMAMSWETTYQTLFKSAVVEEARKKAIAVPNDV